MNGELFHKLGLYITVPILLRAKEELSPGTPCGLLQASPNAAYDDVFEHIGLVSQSPAPTFFLQALQHEAVLLQNQRVLLLVFRQPLARVLALSLDFGIKYGLAYENVLALSLDFGLGLFHPGFAPRLQRPDFALVALPAVQKPRLRSLFSWESSSCRCRPRGRGGRRRSPNECQFLKKIMVSILYNEKT